ncbi:hypothetical protein GYMLUDRAFT_997204 [Collybiopsis luxurians FD-317 M1]|uniref:F-box domain-containing protein n=1 Tax=Collybiopsis luxurians FD-317 M1 TaxID=944289 RepID=A0A0D0CYF1_9AGAR|nr:hypothetical protein GYMLUDRAFT_997204 [Collybiopsis luxurians FD-317 M1]
MIFDYACEWNEFRFERDSSGRPGMATITNFPALAISSTCVRWRLIAEALPSLWSRFRMHVLPSELGASSPLYDAYIATITLMLLRSQTRPLTIHLSFDIDPVRDGNPRSLDLFIEHMHRWASLTSTHPFPIANAHSRHLIALETLDLGAVRHGIHLIKLLEIFGNAPRLTGLSFPYAKPYDLPLSFPRHQITRLDVVTPSTESDAMSKLLDLFPNLTILKVWSGRGPRVAAPFPHAITPKTSTSINSLVVTFSSPKQENSVFSHFTLPSLRRLYLRTVGNPAWEWPGDASAAFISRSSSSITVLQMDGIPLSDGALISVLRPLPSLVSLEINHDGYEEELNPITPNLIDVLRVSHQTNPTRSNIPLIPRLRHLSIVCKGDDFDHETFVATIASRWRPQTHSFITSEGVEVDCLRSVVVKFWASEADQTAYGPLVEMDKMGLRVYVR